MRGVVFSIIFRALGGVAGAPLPRRVRAAARPRRPLRMAESLPAGRLRRERSRVLAVRVVVVPPLVRRGLWVALGRVLPLLLAPERRDVEIAPGGAQVLVAAGVDEVGAEDPVALADEGVVPVPLVNTEILVEVVRDRVPGDELPAHALLQALDIGLGGTRDKDKRRVP